MKIKFVDFDFDNEEIITKKINEVKKQIKLLENTDFTKEIEINEENIKKASKIQEAYRNIVCADWKIKPIQAIIATSSDVEIATIK